MQSTRRFFLVIMVIVLGGCLLTVQSWAVSINLTDSNPTWSAQKEGCCPFGCPTCDVNAWDPILAPVPFTNNLPDNNNIFVQAWNAWTAQGEAGHGWTLVNGGSLAGTFNITQYDAGFKDCCGGVEIWIDYVPGLNDPPEADVVWSQAIETNQKLPGALGPGNPYLDIKTPTGPDDWAPPVYPYQYTGALFYDFPCRTCPSCCDDSTWWNGLAYLTEVDYAGQALTIYEGVDWGFDIACVPEPSTLLLLGSGLFGMLCRLKKKRASMNL
jgi:hypothetical protein